MAIGRTVMHEKPIRDGVPDAPNGRLAPAAWIGAVRIVALRVVMVVLAAFAIFVLLPVAIAAQAIVPV